MIRTGVGQSSSASTGEAAAQAAGAAMAQAGIRRAEGVVVFATVDHLRRGSELLAVLKRVTATDQIVGSSAAGILTGEGEIEGSHGLAVMVFSADRIACRPFLFHPLKDRDDEAGAEIARKVSSGADQNSLLLLFPDSYNGRADRLLRKIESEIGFVPATGAGASEDGSAGATYQLCGGEITSNAVSGLQLSGAFELSLEITQGCRPLTEPMVITKADNNLIFEIDGLPAFELFARALKGPLREDLRRALAYVFVGLPANPDENSVAPGKYLVRNIVGLDSRKGILAVGEVVREGESMIFTLRDGERAREDLNHMLARHTEKLGGRPPDLGFYFNCCARGTSLYGIPGIDTAYIRRALGVFPLIGLFGGYELAPLAGKNHLFAYTGVLALITEKS